MLKHLELLNDVIRIVTFTRGIDMPRRYDALRDMDCRSGAREAIPTRHYEGRGPIR